MTAVPVDGILRAFLLGAILVDMATLVGKSAHAVCCLVSTKDDISNLFDFLFAVLIRIFLV